MTIKGEKEVVELSHSFWNVIRTLGEPHHKT